MHERLDIGALLGGVLVGLIAGGLLALFRAPRSGRETRRQLTEASHELRDQIEEAVTPVDPVAESMAEGKAAARRRRTELGLNR